MNAGHSACRRAIVAHFRGRITPAEEVRMRQHLTECALCRRRYERHMLLADLEPHALEAGERIGRGLGIFRFRGATPRVVAVLMAAAACCMALLLRPRPLAPPSGDFAARGLQSPPAAPSGSEEAGLLEVYHAQPGQPFEPARSAIRANDELAFAYANPAGYPYLIVCGIDEHGHVYWYHPGWTSAADRPESVRVEAGPRIRELPEAISHVLDGRELRIIAAFSATPLHVKDVDRLLSTRPDGRALEVALGDSAGRVGLIERVLKVVP